MVYKEEILLFKEFRNMFEPKKAILKKCIFVYRWLILVNNIHQTKPNFEAPKSSNSKFSDPPYAI